RAGGIAALLGEEAEVTDVGGELGLKCLNPEALYSASGLAVEVQVTAAGQGVAGAHLTLRLADTPITAQARSDAAGHVEIRLPLERLAPGDLVLWVEAGLGGKSVTRKLRLRKNG
ncbi:MAG TPA: carboxypeptidase-like regulatory domain-containing protein, partial [Terriglobales bacterium]|nr:carboxypeptidase-like regulatory domain-containing protein [Terriglobales bacterium]